MLLSTQVSKSHDHKYLSLCLGLPNLGLDYCVLNLISVLQVHTWLEPIQKFSGLKWTSSHPMSYTLSKDGVEDTKYIWKAAR